jgi:hypothetical protein
MASAALASFAVAMYLNQPGAWGAGTTGYLWGEMELDSHEKARKFADLSIQEAKNLWAEPSSNWHTMFNGTRFTENRVAVECRQVTEGSFRDSKVHLARSEGILRGVSAQEALEFMLSPEGLAILDPVGSRTDFYQPIERIPDWREGDAKTEIAEIFIPGRGPMIDRHFLVLGSTIPEEGIFVAKSVIHSSRPGASALYAGKKSDFDDDKHIRSLVTFAIKVEPTVLKDGEEVVSVKMINYVNTFLHEHLMSFASCKWLFPDLYRDLQKAINDKRNAQ